VRFGTDIQTVDHQFIVTLVIDVDATEAIQYLQGTATLEIGIDNVAIELDKTTLYGDILHFNHLVTGVIPDHITNVERIATEVKQVVGVDLRTGTDARLIVQIKAIDLPLQSIPSGGTAGRQHDPFVLKSTLNGAIQIQVLSCNKYPVTGNGATPGSINKMINLPLDFLFK